MGTPSGGLNGVQFLSGGALHIEHCTIFGFTQNAININVNTATGASVFVTDSVVSNAAGGIAARNAAAGKVFLSMQRATVVQNSGFGLKADGSGAGFFECFDLAETDERGELVAFVDDGLCVGGSGFEGAGESVGGDLFQVDGGFSGH